jgi:hypothetical protein
MLISWMDLHANDLPYGRWLVVGKEDVGTDCMDGYSRPTTCLMADGLQSIGVGIGMVYDLIEKNSGVNLS